MGYKKMMVSTPMSDFEIKPRWSRRCKKLKALCHCPAVAKALKVALKQIKSWWLQVTDISGQGQPNLPMGKTSRFFDKQVDKKKKWKNLSFNQIGENTNVKKKKHQTQQKRKTQNSHQQILPESRLIRCCCISSSKCTASSQRSRQQVSRPPYSTVSGRTAKKTKWFLGGVFNGRCTRHGPRKKMKKNTIPNKTCIKLI